MFVFTIFVRALPRISTSPSKKTVFSHLKETKNTKLIYFFDFFACNAKRDLKILIARDTVNKAKTSEIYTPKRDKEHPRLFHMGVPLVHWP